MRCGKSKVANPPKDEVEISAKDRIFNGGKKDFFIKMILEMHQTERMTENETNTKKEIEKWNLLV